jgi:hypothetical protein
MASHRLARGATNGRAEHGHAPGIALIRFPAGSLRMACLWTLIAVFTSISATFVFRLALRGGLWRRTTALLFASLAVSISPCLVPHSASPYRLLSALIAVTILVKQFDLFQQPCCATTMTLRSYGLYLFNFFWLVLRKPPPEVAASFDRRRVVQTVPASTAMICLCVGFFSLDFSGVPFVIEHTAKVALLVSTVVVVVNCAAAIWRLLGGAALDPMRNPALARTPADFWRRWNRPAQQFLFEYGFRAVGGARHPVRGVLATFAISGIVHEYLFGITVGYIQGWQLFFFGLHGIAVLATARIRPRGWVVWPLVGATVAFNLVLAMLFFQSVNSVLPFYSPRDR